MVLSLPFGKASTIEEVIDILTQSGIKCLTIPIKSPAWDINPENITRKGITKILEIIPSNVEVTGLGYSWPSEYTMITESATEWKRISINIIPEKVSEEHMSFHSE